MRITKHTVETPYPVGDVHMYTCELNGAPVLFDTGPPTKEASRYLRENIDLERLEYVFITHCHPDHYGNVKFLEETTSARIVFSQYDTFKYERLEECADIMCDVIMDLGFPPDGIKLACASFRDFHRAVPYPDKYLLLEESSGLLDSLGMSYIRCPGHTQSDIVYLLGDYAISGDVILRKIFTAPLLEVDYDTFKGRFSNYKAYCSTISRLKEIEGKIFLPSHNDFIDSVDERILFFVSKLIERAGTLAAKRKAGKSVYETVRSLFGGRLEGSPLMMYIKISEIVFMYDFLESSELLFEALERNGLYDRIKGLLSKSIV